MAIFCGCLLEGRRPTVVGDGRQTRDWVEVGDVVRANLLAAESTLTGPLNIGTGRETSVLELIEALNDVAERGPIPEPLFADERQGEVRHSCLDVPSAPVGARVEGRVELREGLGRILRGCSRGGHRHRRAPGSQRGSPARGGARRGPGTGAGGRTSRWSWSCATRARTTGRWRWRVAAAPGDRDRAGAFSHGADPQLLMERSHGDHVAFLTQDAVPADQRWLARLLGGFSLADDVGLAFGPYLPRPGASPMVARELTDWFASFSPDGAPRSIGSRPPSAIPAARPVRARGFFTDANGCVSRRAGRRCRFRDVAYAEDHALAHDMLRAGYAKVLRPGAAVVHSHDYSAWEWLRRSFDEARATTSCTAASTRKRPGRPPCRVLGTGRAPTGAGSAAAPRRRPGRARRAACWQARCATTCFARRERRWARAPSGYRPDWPNGCRWRGGVTPRSPRTRFALVLGRQRHSGDRLREVEAGVAHTAGAAFQIDARGRRRRGIELRSGVQRQLAGRPLRADQQPLGGIGGETHSSAPGPPAARSRGRCSRRRSRRRSGAARA